MDIVVVVAVVVSSDLSDILFSNGYQISRFIATPLGQHEGEVFRIFFLLTIHRQIGGFVLELMSWKSLFSSPPSVDSIYGRFHYVSNINP